MQSIVYRSGWWYDAWGNPLYFDEIRHRLELIDARDVPAMLAGRPVRPDDGPFPVHADATFSRNPPRFLLRAVDCKC